MASIKEEMDYPKIWTSNNSKQLSYSKKRRKFDETISWGRSSKDFNDFFELILVGNINNEGGEMSSGMDESASDESAPSMAVTEEDSDEEAEDSGDDSEEESGDSDE